MKEYGQSKMFKDAKKRPIKITIDGGWPATVTARFNESTIGHLEFHEHLDSGLQILAHVDVEKQFQEAGIASRMIKEMIQLDPDLLVPNPQWTNKDDYYYSSEGLKLINSCLKKKILKQKNIACFE